MEGKRVLVVDDNATNLKILNRQLQQWKLEPVLAFSGTEALEILISDPDFHLIISDMHMPGMDGVELTRSIKQRFPAIPVILLSSVGDENRKQFKELFCSVLNKPIRQHILFKCIARELKEQGKMPVHEEQPGKKKFSANFAEQYPLKILVAEDNVINQKLILHVLNKLGYEPEIAESGRAVLESIIRKDFDIVLMDVQMPEIDGMQATRIIRQQHLKQPVIIAMTANAMEEDKQECLQAGMNDYIGYSRKCGRAFIKSVIEPGRVHGKSLFS
jgi:CheY-like chemotaxis protein